MRVRLRVLPGDFGDIEFESFTGMIAVLDGMAKSLQNTEWLATPLNTDEATSVLHEIEHLRSIFEAHREDRCEEEKVALEAENKPGEVSLSYRPGMLH